MTSAGRSASTQPIKVLFIGNIANNAYLNAKILRRYGVDVDVLVHNYYHAMSWPEWEDADFNGPVVDEFYPDFGSTDLGTFSRPRWLAQGPIDACLRYLIARSPDSGLVQDVRWSLLEAQRARACRAGRKVNRIGLRSADHRVNGLRQLLRRSRRLVKKWLDYPFSGTIGAFLQLMNGEGGRAGEEYRRRLETLVKVFSLAFPDRDDKLDSDDLRGVGNRFLQWHRLLSRYDAVVGYATDGIHPLLCGKRPYLAYEHGTIRSIPFEDSRQGRLCALTYRCADMTLITNCDDREAARKLGIERYLFVPHPINEDTRSDKKAASDLRHRLAQSVSSNFIVFHPARHHWEQERHPSWEKGNDIFIKGFARFVRDSCPTAGAVFVEWGKTVEQSKALLAQLGISDRVLWVHPMPNARMVEYIAACDLVADQFFLGAFGSIMPKALFHGCPTMLYLDEELHRWCFFEMPPVINACTPDEVLAGLTRLYREPDYRGELVAKGRQWYERYHSNRVIVERFTKAFDTVLSENASSSEGV